MTKSNYLRQIILRVLGVSLKRSEKGPGVVAVQRRTPPSAGGRVDNCDCMAGFYDVFLQFWSRTYCPGGRQRPRYSVDIRPHRKMGGLELF